MYKIIENIQVTHPVYGVINKKIIITYNDYGVELERENYVGAPNISISGNTSATSKDVPSGIGILNSQNAFIYSGITNTVIIAGKNITGNTSNTLYTQNLKAGENGGSLYSGGTNLSSIFLSTATTFSTTNTIVQAGTNITTGGTQSSPIISTTINPLFNNISAVSLSGGTMSGGTLFSGSTNLGTIIQSFVAASNVIPTYVNQGTNITTGGTLTNPAINVVASPNFTNVNASGIFTGPTANITAITGQTVSGGTYYSGSTLLSTIIQSIANGTVGSSTAVQPGTNITTGGTQLVPIINVVASPAFTNISSSGVITGPTLNVNVITGQTISGGTYYSGSSLLSAIIQSFIGTNITVPTYINQGTNITTGGTLTNPTINVVANPNFTNVNASGVYSGPSANITAITGQTISGGTIYSGSTLLSTIIQSIANGTIGSSTAVQPVTNITTGGTQLVPIINVVDSPIFNNISLSGTAFTNGLSAITLSGGTIFSGSTNLSSIIQSFIGTNVAVPTYVNQGTNITTGGTLTNPAINVVASPNFTNVNASGIFTGPTANVTAITGQTVSGGTIYSGSTDLSLLFQKANSVIPTYVNQGTNITTGGTLSNPTINVVASPSFTNISSSGVITSPTLNVTAISGQTISGGTIYSGSTDLSLLFQKANSVVPTYINQGTNITTGGTSTNPTINVVVNPLFGNVNFSGITSGPTTNITAITGQTISGGTYYSGSTLLSQIIQSIANGTLGNSTAVQAGTNISTGGTQLVPIINVIANPIFTNVSATTLSGGTLFSGSTNLGTIIQSFVATSNVIPTYVNQGTNITTGGTLTNPTINVVASPLFSTVTAINISGGTLSGGTIYSGSTLLSTIIQSIANGTVGSSTAVQAGTNISTGGTQLVPIINVIANPIFTSVSASTISGGTLFSGSTALGNIFLNSNSLSAGTNITLTTTGNKVTINASSSGGGLTQQQIEGLI